MNEIIKQFEAMKAQYPDAIMIFRNGACYTCVKEDASVCAEVTGLPIDVNYAEDGEIFLSVSFYVDMLDLCLPMLVRKGNRVAILEPLERAV